MNVKKDNLWFLLLGLPVGWLIAWLIKGEPIIGDLSNSDWRKGYEDARNGAAYSPPLLFGKDDYAAGYQTGQQVNSDVAKLSLQVKS